MPTAAREERFGLLRVGMEGAAQSKQCFPFPNIGVERTALSAEK